MSYGWQARALMCVCILAVCAGTGRAQGPGESGITTVGEKKGLDTVLKDVFIRDMDLNQAVRLLAAEANINIVTGKDVQGKVTCSLVNVTARSALHAFLTANGYDFIQHEGVLIVLKEGSAPTKIEGGAPVSPAGVLLPPVKIVHRTFTIPYIGTEGLSQVSGSLEGTSVAAAPLQSSNAKPMDAIIHDMLTPTGKMVFYQRQHIIIVEDTEDAVKAIDELVQQLWSVPSQVFIDAKLLEVQLDSDKSLGVQWQAVQSPADRTNINSDGTMTTNRGTALWHSTAPTVPEFAGATSSFFNFGISDKHIDVLVNALAARNRVDTRSNPTVLVSNHGTATMVAGEEVPYLTSIQSTGALPIQTFSFKEVTVRLEVTPHASDDGMIFLDVHPTVKDVVDHVGTPPQPVLSVREAATSVVMRDGTTLMIGGLLQRKIQNKYQEVPFIARIPLLGWLFQQKSDADSKNELIFLVNPRILTPKLMKELAHKNRLRLAEPHEHEGESPANKPKW